ncbi:MAG TPA: hypothetical protein VH253_01910 [Phycisphaerae bacterium]|nr:hypothetical protein [Phycisphaerae bacterium]
MAELIPMEYRLRNAQRQHLAKWVTACVATLALCGAALGYGVMWEKSKERDAALLSAEFRDKSTLITRSQELRSKRQDLANRMEKIQELRDDKVLLALLRSVADSFSADDCLETVKVEAHGAHADGTPAAAGDSDDRYAVHLSGITTNSTTLAALMTRLTKQDNPPINVVLENSHRDKLLDGQVMRFQIMCEKPGSQGT